MYELWLLLMLASRPLLDRLRRTANGKGQEAKDEEAPAVPVEVQPPKRGGDGRGLFGHGARSKRTRRRRSSPRWAVKSAQILVEEGDTVKAGQVLARLDGDRLRLEVQRTEPTCQA